jgi:hypothetical protein
LFGVPAELLPAAAIATFLTHFLRTNGPASPEKCDVAQQTVDGLHGALEIDSRSSYVPNAPIGV